MHFSWVIGPLVLGGSVHLVKNSTALIVCMAMAP